MIKFTEINEDYRPIFREYKGFISVSYSDGDWCGYYFNNQLIYQGHSMNEREFFESCQELNVNFNSILYLHLDPTEEQTDTLLSNLPEAFSQLMEMLLNNKIKHEFEEIKK